MQTEESHSLAVDHEEAPRQELLPPLRWLLQPNDDRFAHPAEIELARLLTFYGLRWAYEPTTFAVRWGRDGRPVEFVTPDFYLPEHDLYLELTTMRQRLVTRKNRKFRLLRETYPNVRVRLLYLRDFKRLRDVYGPSDVEREARISAILYAEQDVEMRIAQLAHQLIEAWDGKMASERGQRPLLVGVGSGSDRFLGVAGRESARLGRSGRSRSRRTDLDRRGPWTQSCSRVPTAYGVTRRAIGDAGTRGVEHRPERDLSHGLDAPPRGGLRGNLRAHGSGGGSSCRCAGRVSRVRRAGRCARRIWPGTKARVPGSPIHRYN